MLKKLYVGVSSQTYLKVQILILGFFRCRMHLIQKFLCAIFVTVEDRPLVEDLLKSNWLLSNFSVPSNSF